MKVSKVPFYAITTALLSFAVAPMASASDGVLEINQTCALQTGCFPGDSPGYPVTIGTSGAFRLTSNLRTSDATDVAVRINVSHVNLDLNGFGISCSEFTPPFTFTLCSSNENSVGIGVEAVSPVMGVRVRNGNVSNMAAKGISLYHGHISSVTAIQNGRSGLVLGGGGIIEKCTALENGKNGIATLGAAQVSGNAVQQNGLDGIRAGDGSTVIGNVSVDNGRDGIGASRSVISQNSVRNNAGDGIDTISGGSIHANLVDSNGGWGLRMNFTTGFRGNTITSNGFGPKSLGVNLGDNTCGSVICP